MYHLFGGTQCYYASGGGNDFIGSFSSVEDAECYVKHLKVVQPNYLEELDGDVDDNLENLDWWHIVDSEFNTVKESKETPHSSETGVRYLEKVLAKFEL